MNKIMFVLVALVLSFGTYSGCGKDKDDKKAKAGKEEVPEPTTSFLLASKSDLPPCNSGRAGYLAYVTDESKFYACDGTDWIETDIKGPKGDPGEKGETGAPGSTGTGSGGGIGVYDANGQRLGALLSYDLSNDDYATVLFSNGGVAKLDFSTGKIAFPTQCAYTSNNCIGTCYASKRTSRSSILKGQAGLLKSTGSESTSSINIVSFWNYSNESCVVSPSGTMNYYPVSESYSFPSDLTYPFANGELTLK